MKVGFGYQVGHVTVIETDKKRSTISTGLCDNVSHSGEDSGETIDMVIGSCCFNECFKI